MTHPTWGDVPRGIVATTGNGGLSPPPMNRPPAPTLQIGVQPGTTPGVVVRVVISASGAFTGLFVYSPSPGAGNLIDSIAAAPGTDPFGNTYQAGITTYTPSSTSFARLFNGEIQFADTASHFWEILAQTAGELLVFQTPGTGADLFLNSTGTLQAAAPGTPTVPETPHAPSLNAGWATGSATAGFQPIEYWLTPDGPAGIVELDGTFHSTSATPSATIWTFPSGWFNPTNAQRLPVVINNNAGAAVAGILSISTAGAVTIALPAIGAASEDVHVAARFRIAG